MLTVKRCFVLALCLTLCMISVQAYALAPLQIFAGKGTGGAGNGQPLVATFLAPYGLAISAAGDLLISDSNNNLLRQVSGETSTVAGRLGPLDAFGYPQGSLVDGAAADSYFNRPRGLAIDAQGTVYVADSQNHAIRKLSRGQVRTLAGNGQAGYQNGQGASVRFNTPSGLAIGADGSLYVADTLNHVIRRISPAGVVSTFAGTAGADGGYADGTAALARFNEPSALAFTPAGELLVADAGNQLIRKISAGQVSTLAGQFNPYPPDSPYSPGAWVDGSLTEARFSFPKGLAVAENGAIFVADTWNHAVRAITPEGQVITIAIPETAGGAEALRLDGPVGLAYASGQLYIADQWANAVWQLAVDVDHLQPVGTPDPGDEQDQQPVPIDFDPDTSVIQVWLNGQRVLFPDQQPTLVDGRTRVPLRFVCQQWGATVDWDAEQNRVIVTRGASQTTIPADGVALVNQAGRTLVGLRYLAESLGFRVEWVAAHRAVVLTTP